MATTYYNNFRPVNTTSKFPVSGQLAAYDAESEKSILNTLDDIARANGYPLASEITPTTTNFTINNNNPTYTGGTWVATLGADGVTYLTGTGVTGEGITNGSVTIPANAVNLLNTTSVTIQAGAVVSNVVITGGGTGSDLVNRGGTIERSFVVNMTSKPQVGQATPSISQGNVYLGTTVLDGTNGTPPVSNSDFYIDPTAGASFTINNTRVSPIFDYTLLYPKGKFNSLIMAGSGKTMNLSGVSATVFGCFLPGTMIETIKGLVTVEDIQVGDQVVVYNNGKKDIQSVVWTGYNTVKAFGDDDSFPICIMKDAISENVPNKDLFVTSEHSIVINDQFIPARMLVNDSTIFYDYSITEYTFYHIETEEHSVISADNVLTESYLDTGNRSHFLSQDNVVSIVNKNKEWNVDSALPLVTNSGIVEPIFSQLLERAKELGFSPVLDNILKTGDSDFHLLADSGEVLRATYHNDGRFVFRISPEVQQVRLISRASKPSQAIGPFVDDRRSLGVLVGNVILLEKNIQYDISEHITSEYIQGWHNQEPMNARWTDGNALLTVRTTPSDSVGMLVIHVLSAGPYIVAEGQEVQLKEAN